MKFFINETSSKTAILYTRVSTEEQAENGFRLRSQKELLEKYCQSNGIKILKHFEDHYSAKTFLRPAFMEMEKYIKANKGKIDFILVKDWDRFSRGDLVEQLLKERELNQHSVELRTLNQTTEKLSPSEVLLKELSASMSKFENTLRSNRVREGMARAKKEGWHLTRAPYGYKKIPHHSGKKILSPNETEAVFVKKAFKLVSEGHTNVQEVRKRLSEEGFSVSKSRFYEFLKNPVYMGKLFGDSDTPDNFLDGCHEAIVSEELFYKVQQRLNPSSKKEDSYNQKK